MNPPSSSLSRQAWRIVSAIVLLQLLACTLGSLRADDWVNLERGRIVFSPEWRTIWTTLNPFTLYRPLVDVWHGSMLALFGLEPRPMLAALVGVLLLQSVLLARIVRELGGSRETAALAALAVWVQANTYSWTTLWVSNVTGSLMTLFSLLTLWLMVRAVRIGAQGRGFAWSLAAIDLALIAAALCKEEAVLLPGIAMALAASRWRHAPAAERRTWMTVLGSVLAVAAAYALFRTQMLPTPQAGENRYHLRLGAHVLRNLAFFAVHLGALPVVALAIARATLPMAFAREAREQPEWRGARDAMLAGLAWAAIACTLYLPISGRPAYGYLYAPAFGIAFAVGHGLGFAALVQARLAQARSAVTPLVIHACLAIALTAFGLAANGWHRFGEIQREAVATLRRLEPAPPPGTLFVFLDPGRKETLSGRSLFSLVFDGTTASMLRLTYGRPDLQSKVVAADTLEGPPLSAGARVFRTRAGRIFPSRP